MKITKITIESKAVKAYQTFSTSFEVEAEEPVNMKQLRQLEDILIAESVAGVNKLCDSIGVEAKAEPKVEVNKTKTQYNREYSERRFPATEKQLAILKKYGYKDPDMSSKEAGELIKQLREQGGKY